MSRNFDVFNPFKNFEKGEQPCDVFVQISLIQYFTSNDGVITISENLATDLEIDNAINQLQKDLESVRKKAKRALKAQQDKIRF